MTEAWPRRAVVVHERFTEPGGSEAVVGAIVAATGAHRVLAPVVDPVAVPPTIAGIVEGGPLRALYPGGGRYAHLLPLLPWSIGRLDVGDADLVVASHHAFANRVRVPAGVPFVSYTHTPPRWVWDEATAVLEDPHGLSGRLLRAFAVRQRAADCAAAQRPDVVVANSSAVAERIRRWWGRVAQVVAPPVDTGFFQPDPGVPREAFVLWAGRLVPYKRPEVAVLAARAAGVRLVVAGEGRSRRAMEELAGPETVFLGRVSDLELRRLLRTCRALVFPGEEDFGIVPVEAMACGAPVVALDAGGVRDTVVDGVTGRRIAVAKGAPTEVMADAFAAVIRDLAGVPFDPAAARRQAERFSPEVFRRRFRAVVDEARRVHGSGRPGATTADR